MRRNVRAQAHAAGTRGDAPRHGLVEPGTMAAHYAVFCIMSLLGDLKGAYVLPSLLRFDIGLEAIHLSLIKLFTAQSALLRAH